MKAAKNAPAASGNLIPSTTGHPIVKHVTTTPVSVTPAYYYPKAPSVFIRPHSQPRDKYIPVNDLDQPRITVPSNDISNLRTPSIYYEPPKHDEHSLPPIVVLPSSTPASNEIEDESHLPPLVVLSTTARPSTVEDESHLPPIANYPSSTEKPTFRDESSLPPIAYYPSSTASSVIPLSGNPSSANNDDDLVSYRVVPITSRPQSRYRPSSYRHESSTERTIVDYDRNTIDAAASYASPSYQKLANNVPLFDRSKYAAYDGVGVTANGFRYFLPRHYQEETSNGDGSRDGSYGYIDPFGIRRVVYYNAGQKGVIMRKNNRYVGFDSTPFDPRPN
jgi:Insect cuticle protein